MYKFGLITFKNVYKCDNRKTKYLIEKKLFFSVNCPTNKRYLMFPNNFYKYG